MAALLVQFIVIVILFSAAYYAVNALLPESIKKFAMVLLYVIAAIAVCWLLLSMVGGTGALSHFNPGRF